MAYLAFLSDAEIISVVAICSIIVAAVAIIIAVASAITADNPEVMDYAPGGPSDPTSTDAKTPPAVAGRIFRSERE